MSVLTCKACEKPTSGAKLCDHCCRTLAISLANGQAFYEDLGLVAAKSTRYGDSLATRGSIGRVQPMPVDPRFVNVPGTEEHPPVDGRAVMSLGSQLRWDVWNSVVTWCRLVMAEAGPLHHGPACPDCIHPSCTLIRRTRWPRSTVRSMFAYFDRQFRLIVRADWCADFLDEMLDNETRMRRVIDRPADRWYAGRCLAHDQDAPTCQAELYASTEDGKVTCPACGTVHDIAARRDVLLREASDHLVTATGAAQALIAWTDYDGTENKLADQVQKWRDRGKLEVRDVTSLNGRDRHLYRLGDVQQLLIEAAQRAQAKRVKSA